MFFEQALHGRVIRTVHPLVLNDSTFNDGLKTDREVHMKKKWLTMIILLGVVALTISCAGLTFIPKGSKAIGIYDGYFYGVRYGGSIRVFLYQTPQNDKLFLATIALEPGGRDHPSAFFVRGKMTANALEGEFQGDATGTMSGRMSPDGSRLTGYINLTAPDLNDGTWQAKKK